MIVIVSGVIIISVIIIVIGVVSHYYYYYSGSESSCESLPLPPYTVRGWQPTRFALGARWLYLCLFFTNKGAGAPGCSSISCPGLARGRKAPGACHPPCDGSSQPRGGGCARGGRSPRGGGCEPAPAPRGSCGEGAGGPGAAAGALTPLPPLLPPSLLLRRPRVPVQV